MLELIVLPGLALRRTCTSLALCAGLVCALPPALARASTFTTLYEFIGGSTGSGPGGIVEDASGTVYGGTYQAGDTKCVTSTGNPKLGCGIFYSFSRSAGLKTLVTFNGANGAYGNDTPTLIGSTLFGSTVRGGSSNNGVLFTLHTDGSSFRLLHQFDGVDGSGPSGPLVASPSHVLYGVTSVGGAAYPAASYGVLFRITAAGTYTVLHTFDNGTGGGSPNSIVVEKSGIIIGSTLSGGYKGKSCGSIGCGVLYEYNPATGQFKLLYTFTATKGSGLEPVLGSVAANGTIYGNDSQFFQLSPVTGFSPLNATGGSAIGYGAYVAPVLGPDGSLTSTEPEGPYTGGVGTLYQQLNGVLTALHTFSGGDDGAGPISAPVVRPSGIIIGTASDGGTACSCGTIYEYSP